MNNIKLRKWQQKAIDEINTCQSTTVLISAPTGAGKAFLIMSLVHQYIQRSKRVLLLVDRIALVKQLSATAKQFNLDHNIIQANNTKSTTPCLFTIGSQQTYFKRQHSTTPDLILIDEAHTLYTPTTDYLTQYKGKLIGLTATPFTVGLADIYDTVINPTTSHQLLLENAIVPISPKIMTKIDMGGAKIINGEWQASVIEERTAKILGYAPQVYLEHAKDKRAICFCASIKHCKMVADDFAKHNIQVGVYTSQTSEEDRKQLLRQFDNKEIMILISVSALSKGFDRPYVECLIDMRPLRKSLAEYVQSIGRGVRTNQDKKECILLDFTGNYQRFLPEYIPIFTNGIATLKSKNSTDKKPIPQPEFTTCPTCGNKFCTKVCLYCGYKDITDEVLEALCKDAKNRNEITIDTVDIGAIELEISKTGLPMLPSKIFIKENKRVDKVLLSGGTVIPAYNQIKLGLIYDKGNGNTTTCYRNVRTNI